jgi:hypothetical protein
MQNLKTWPGPSRQQAGLPVAERLAAHWPPRSTEDYVGQARVTCQTPGQARPEGASRDQAGAEDGKPAHPQTTIHQTGKSGHRPHVSLRLPNRTAGPRGCPGFQDRPEVPVRRARRPPGGSRDVHHRVLLDTQKSSTDSASAEVCLTCISF